MSQRVALTWLGRAILVVLTLYALLLIVPDFVRIVRPLGSFGLAANGDGRVFDVRGPFETDADSPAARAGVKVGDELDLPAMRCVPAATDVCAANLSLWGGVGYVVPGRRGILRLLPRGETPAREVTLVAEQRPRSVAIDIVLTLTQIAGVLVVLGAAYLVWIRPGPMTWGFFAYVLYFNPGGQFQISAWLQLWPRALLAQAFASCVLQAVGYAGLILFAMRAPVGRAEDRWRGIERALPAFAAVILVIELMSLGSLFGFRTEFAMRGALIAGFLVSAAAIAILIARRSSLSPHDFQRLRWVIWGALIGLPANLIAEIWQETSLPNDLFGAGAASEDVSGLFFLINGVLCLFVVEAVRRPTVVSVWVPLRRATVLGLLLSVPAYFIHEELNTINEWTALPEWAWVLLASVLIFLISRLHEWTTELADRLFDSDFRRAERKLEEVGREIQEAESLADIERLLIEEPRRALRLASAAVFREEDGVLRRRAAEGWEGAPLVTLKRGEPPLTATPRLDPFPIAAPGAGAPTDLGRPVFGVPIGNPRQLFAVALYSAHEAGTDLDSAERALLGGLARDAEVAYGQVEREGLRRRVKRLEGPLGDTASGDDAHVR